MSRCSAVAARRLRLRPFLEHRVGKPGDSTECGVVLGELERRRLTRPARTRCLPRHSSAATGDIPDNQVFLAFTNQAAGYCDQVPGGMDPAGAAASDVTFSDKNNIVHVRSRKASAPTPSIGAAELNALEQTNPTLNFAAPHAIQLKPGSAVKARYTTESAPNPVTGKRVKLIVDRYELARGRQRRDRGSRHAERRRQRRRLPDDDRQLPLAVSAPGTEPRSLCVEPDGRWRQIEWPALQFHDVFKIFRSGPVETVALRGLDLAVRARRAGGRARPVGLRQEHDARARRGARRAVGRRGARRWAAAAAARRAGARAEYRAREVALVLQSDNLWPALSARRERVDRRCGSPDARSRRRGRGGACGVRPRGRGAKHWPAPCRAASSSGSRSPPPHARRAPLVLADEPTGELDAGNEQRVLDALRELRDAFGSTVVVVTHSARVCGRG